MTVTQHTSATIAEVRRLAAGGWGPTEIARIMARDGVPLAVSTIRYWICDEERVIRRERDRVAKRQRRAERITGGLGTVRHSPEFKATRMRALRRAGLSYAAVAKVMRLDYGEELSHDKLRRMVKGAV